jgi:hypothetical protein
MAFGSGFEYFEVQKMLQYPLEKYNNCFCLFWVLHIVHTLFTGVACWKLKAPSIMKKSG